MLSYLIVILSLKKLENRLHKLDEKIDWQEERVLDTKAKKILKNQHCLLSMLVSRVSQKSAH